MSNVRHRLAFGLITLLWCLLELGLAQAGVQASDPPVPTGLWATFNNSTPNYPGDAPVVDMDVDYTRRSGLWVGTDGDGVGMYDGFTWTVYNVANTNGGLLSDTVYFINAESGLIWIGGPNGLSIYYIFGNEWYHYTTADGLPTNEIRGVAFGGGIPSHDYFFATGGFGVVICDDLPQFPGILGPIECTMSETQANGLLQNDFVFDISDSSLDRWMVTAAGVTRVYDPLFPPVVERTHYGFNTPGCPAINEANKLTTDFAHGRVWVTLSARVFAAGDPGPGQGACVFDMATETWRSFNTGNSGLGDNSVMDVAIDREGRAWFGAMGEHPGVYVYTWITDSCCWKAYKTDTPGAQLSENSVRSVVANRDRVYFGHLTSVTGFALHWQKFPRDVGALASLTGQLWVGTPAELLTFDGVNFTTVRPNVNVKDILALAPDDVSIATTSGLHRWNGGNWQQFTTANSGIASNDLTAVAQDNLDRIWVGSVGNGVSVFNLSGNNWAIFDTSNVLPSNNVRDVFATATGDVWVSSAGGVSLFDGSNWRTFTTANGLPSNDARGIAMDTFGQVFVGTQAGAAKYSEFSGTWFTPSSDTPTTTPFFAAHAPASGGVWFGTNEGALLFNGGAWTRYRSTNSGLSNELVRAISSDATGAVWFGGTPYVGPGNVAGGLFVRSVDAEPLGDEIPSILSFTPASATAGMTVTISGTGFQPGSKVFFGVNGLNGGVLSEVISSTNTSIAILLPSQAIRGKLRVTNSVGATTSADDFLPIPVITSIDPSSSAIGLPIKIMGTNLASTGFSEVKFGASVYSSLIISTSTHNLIEAVIPADASSGAVMVKTSSGEATGPDLTLSGGGLKLLAWEVHQGLPEYQDLVAGKSTVVRLFLGSDAPSGCAYVTGALLQILGPGGSHIRFAQVQTNGGIPNNGWFCGLTKQVAAGGSIDFVIPGEYVATGKSNLAVSFSSRIVNLFDKVLGDYIFAPTDDLRVHIAAPGWEYWSDPNVYGAMTEAQTGLSLFNRQIVNLTRIYPVRDGMGGHMSQNGLRYVLSPFFTLCNGVDDGFCSRASNSYNFLYDFWQENLNGVLRYCMVQTRFPSNTTDDGSVMTFKHSLKPDDLKRMDFIVLVRPGAALPADLNTLVAINTGSPDLVVESREIVRAFSGPAGCPMLNYTDMFMFRTRVRNTGTTEFTNHLITMDYDETKVNSAANGGMVLGNGAEPQTYVQPGQFFMIDGAQGDMFDPPMDLNYNGTIDNDDKALFLMEFDNWDTATGEFTTISGDFSLVSPKDVIRNFIDADGDQTVDTNEQWGPYLERHRETIRYAIYDVPRAYRDAFNESSPVDMQFSQLWLWNRVNPFDLMGLGGQAPGNVSMWADMDGNTGIVHETGHNVGLAHAGEFDIPNVPYGYNIVERRVVLGADLKSAMAPAVTGPIENAFFNPLQYHHVFTFFRNQFDDVAVRNAAVNAGPVIHLAGTVSQDGHIEVSTSYLSTQLPTTPIDVAGGYWLRLAGDDEVLATYRFGVPFGVEDLAEGETLPESASFAVTQPWKDGTKFIEIWDSTKRLFQLPVSHAAPSVTVQSPNGGENVAAEGTLTVKWSGSDADGDALIYAVYYSPDGGTTWNPLSAATNANQIAVPAAEVPGGANALVEVRVSDGVHTASDRSNGAFQVAGKEPLWAAIVSPNAGEQLVQSQRQTLAGSAYDLEDGQLAGSHLAWHSDQLGDLGSGDTVSVTLPAGIHLLTLVATDSANMTASSSITVEVLADFDSDGLADLYEQQYAELAWWNFDDAGADPDGDGLTSRSEAAWGTNPGNEDSDGDGVSDGDEAAAGSLPTDATSKPQAARVLASEASLSFAMAAGGANPASTQLFLMSSTPTQMAWTASVQGAWLKLNVSKGDTPDEVTVSVVRTGLAAGEYQGQITLQGGGTPWTIPVTLTVADPTPPWEREEQLQLHLPLIDR